MRLRTLLTAGLLFALPTTVAADTVSDFQCEVLVLSGTVKAYDTEGRARELKEGDLLRPGEQVESGAESFADLSYDRDWMNVTRLEPDSRMKIASIAPGRLLLDRGAIFAKLKKLPQDSTFEVKTPTAVATVRGSEYRTVFAEGKSHITNAAGSSVIVYGLLEDGNPDKDNAVRLAKDMKTSIEAVGRTPQAPLEASQEDKAAVQTLTKGIEENVKLAESLGRTANIQEVRQIESFLREQKKQSKKPRSIPEDAELSRVTDDRRRAFGGGESVLAPPQEEDPAPKDA